MNINNLKLIGKTCILLIITFLYNTCTQQFLIGTIWNGKSYSNEINNDYDLEAYFLDNNKIRLFSTNNNNFVSEFDGNYSITGIEDYSATLSGSNYLFGNMTLKLTGKLNFFTGKSEGDFITSVGDTTSDDAKGTWEMEKNSL